MKVQYFCFTLEFVRICDYQLIMYLYDQVFKFFACKYFYKNIIRTFKSLLLIKYLTKSLIKTCTFPLNRFYNTKQTTNKNC